MGLAAFNRMRRLKAEKEKLKLEQKERVAERAKLERGEKASQEAARRLQAYREFMKEKQEDEKIAKKRKPKEVTKDDKPGKAKKSDRRK